MKFKDKTPTASELEILGLLWKTSPLSVKEVHEQLGEKKGVGYTTTLKIMQLMVSKGILKREQQGKSHIYYPAQDQNHIQERLLDTFLDSAFGGSASSLVMQLLGNNKASKDELDKIKEFIRNIENQKK